MLSQDKKDKINALYSVGRSINSISEEIGSTTRTIKKNLTKEAIAANEDLRLKNGGENRRNMQFRSHGTQSMYGLSLKDDGFIRRAVAAKESGATVAQIAKRFGSSWYVLKEEAIKRGFSDA